MNIKCESLNFLSRECHNTADYIVERKIKIKNGSKEGKQQYRNKEILINVCRECKDKDDRIVANRHDLDYFKD